MNTYKYTALSPDGTPTKGVVQAVDEYDAVDKIKATCPIVTNISAVKGKKGILNAEIGGRKINQKNLSVMCSQFAIILQSGVNIARAMEMISTQIDDKKLKKILAGAAQDVSQGTGVADSFERNGPDLPATFIESVRAGEKSGTIDRSFRQMEQYYERAYKTEQKVRQALTYPAFVIVIAIVVLIVVMAKVIPTLAATFSDLGGKMPAITKAMIGMSHFFGSHWIPIVSVIVLMALGIEISTLTEKGHIFWSRVALKMPVVGNINVLSASSQFANTMAVLLSAGLGVDEAVDVTGKSLSNYILKAEVRNITSYLQEGRSLGDCMKRCKHFPDTLVDMCSVGEETGELDQTLRTTGQYFDNEADHATKQAVAKLEPAILILLAFFAGFIVFAIYLPIFTMYNYM